MFVRFVLYNRPAEESYVGRTSLSMGGFFFNSVECVQFSLFLATVLGFIISFLRLLPKFFPRLF